MVDLFKFIDLKRENCYILHFLDRLVREKVNDNVGIVKGTLTYKNRLQ